MSESSIRVAVRLHNDLYSIILNFQCQLYTTKYVLLNEASFKEDALELSTLNPSQEVQTCCLLIKKYNIHIEVATLRDGQVCGQSSGVVKIITVVVGISITMRCCEHRVTIFKLR